MPTVFFITHPEVVIEPVLAVTDWRLSDLGRARMARFAAAPEIAGVRTVWCSDERKAVEAATMLTGRLGLAPPLASAGLRENDRSATGYLPKLAFAAMADRFFARPEDSAGGWETARAAQARIVAAVDQVLAGSRAQGDVAIVAHGGVGTLLLCRLKAQPISRSEDQPAQGHYFAFDRGSRRLHHGWRSIG